MEWEETPVLVTGGDGFIGSRLVRKLEEAGADVTVASNKKNAGGKFISMDVTDPSSLDFEGQEAVFHLAGIADPRICEENPQLAFLVNSYGSLNVMEACRSSGIGRMLLSSSAHVYGIPQYTPIDEKHPLRPVSSYGRSKVAAEHICRAYNATILRFFNIYGPGQKGDYLIPTILSSIGKGSIELRNLDSRRDFVYIDDVVDAMLLAIDFPGESINIGSGTSHSSREIAEILFEVSGKSPEVKSMNRQDAVPNLVADISRARKLLNWEPRVSLQEGLKKVYESTASYV